MKLNHLLIGVLVILFGFAFTIDYFFPSPQIWNDLELDEYFLITDEGTNPGAPIILVEFLDYQCPYCLSMHGDIKKLLSNYPGKINYIVRHLPADVHPFALVSALASECARDEGKFIEYHTLLLEKGVSGVEDLYGYANELGLGETFTPCLTGKEKLPVIQEHVQEAITHNVKGTPIFFLNGRRLEGAQDYFTLQSLVEAILEND